MSRKSNTKKDTARAQLQRLAEEAVLLVKNKRTEQTSDLASIVCGYAELALGGNIHVLPAMHHAMFRLKRAAA